MDILKIELERAMGLTGVGTVRELRERQAAGEAGAAVQAEPNKIFLTHP